MFFVWAKKTSIAEAIEFAVLPSKIFGLFSVKFEGKRFVISRYSQIFGVIVCMFFWITFIVLILFSKDIPSQTYVTVTVDYIDSFLLCCIPSVAVFEFISSFANVNQIFKTFSEAETLLTQMGQQPVVDCSLKYIWAQSIMVLLCWITVVNVSVLEGASSVFLLVAVVFVVKLCVLVTLVHRYSGLVGILAALNGHCAKVLLTGPCEAFKLVPLTRLHDILHDTAYLVHDSQVLQIFVIILFSFFIFVTAGYQTYESLLLPSHWTKYNTLILELSWLFSCFLLTLQITGACAHCTKKAKEFNMLLYQLMIDDKTDEISNNKKLRLHISMKREVVFTACGFFTLDYTLVHSMIAAATTYLVILIQFGQPSSTSKDQPTSLPNSTTTGR